MGLQARVRPCHHGESQCWLHSSSVHLLAVHWEVGNHVLLDSSVELVELKSG